MRAGARGWRTRWQLLGVAANDVALMIDTHLHFDHAGGNTYVDAEGQVRLTFPRARYVVQRAEYMWATNTNERTAASYFPHNFVPVMEAGRLELVQGEVEIVPGITLDAHAGPHAGASVGAAGFRWGDGAASWPTWCPRRRTCRCRGSWATTWSRW